MVIYIDKSIGQRIAENAIGENDKIIFTDLALSYQKGNCILCGDLDSLDKLSQQTDLGLHGIYKKVYNQHAESKIIIDSVEKVVVLTYADKNNMCIPEFIKDKNYVINLENAEYINFSTPTFIGENLDDCKFYEYLGRYYLHNHGLSGTEIQFHQELGAGSTISTVLEKCVCNDKCLSLCIVDSDRKHGKSANYPNDAARGSTATELLKTDRKLKRIPNHVPYDVYCLNVHEAENLIPISIIEKASPIEETKETIAVLKALRKVRDGTPLYYYDLKPESKKDSSKPPRNTSAQYTAYWKEISKESKIDIFPHVNNRKLLHTAINLLGNEFDLKLDDYLVEEWETIGLKVYTWGCVKSPIRV